MKKKEFLDGIKDGIPICLGYFSVSMAFGLTAVLSGMPVWATILISMTNLTSAGQFAGATQLLAHGSMIELAFSMFIINIRYFLMSLSVSQKSDSKMNIFKRLAVSFGITDEIFAVSVQRKKALSATYMAGLILTSYLGWVGGTVTGAIATSIMPEVLASSMGIALYGMFIAIVIPPAKRQRNVMWTVIFAALLSFAFNYLPLLSKISSGWATIIITVSVSALAATLFPIITIKKPEGDSHEN
ncbi:MAG: AzlC family ABC transporter permease [Clostridia bacterium]|nr:AzlC family ABC transporter permease [Clostridia bacterium]